MKPVTIGDLDLRAGQAPGAAPHLVLEVPVPRAVPGEPRPVVAGTGLDRREVEELRDVLDEWLR